MTIRVCIYKVTCMHLQSYNWKKLTACVRACMRACIRSSLHSRCAHKRIVNLMKVYSEMKNIQVELIRFRKKYCLFHVNFCEARYSTRLACLRLDGRYNISMFDGNHFNYPWHVATVLCTKLARKVLPRFACSVSANLLLFTLFLIV